MPKQYKKEGDALVETETKTEEKRFTLKELRNDKRSIISRIEELNAEKDAIQLLIDEAIKLNIKE